MTQTSISWTDHVWNPVRGCSRVSTGCEHCYAERMAHRFSGKDQPYEGLTVLGKHGPRWTGSARFIPEKLAEPLSWRKPRRCFVNSMSDLFHEGITDEQIAAAFGVMAATPHITYQILTKRPARMLEWFARAACNALDRCAVSASDALDGLVSTPRLAWSFAPGRGARVWPLPNVHLGVSVEDQRRADERIPLLLDQRVKAAVRWVSMEPLLGPVQHIDGLDWVVVGGESGPGARPCSVSWVRSIVERCKDAGVPCFVKQLGSANACAHSSSGACLECMPEDLRVRQWPKKGDDYDTV